MKAPELKDWNLEIGATVLVGVPWYLFSANMGISLSIHSVLAVLFLFLRWCFGPGAVVVVFLDVLIVSIISRILLSGILHT